MATAVTNPAPWRSRISGGGSKLDASSCRTSRALIDEQARDPRAELDDHDPLVERGRDRRQPEPQPQVDDGHDPPAHVDEPRDVERRARDVRRGLERLERSTCDAGIA